MTPKIDNGETAFTLRSRDYKAMIALVIQENDENDGYTELGLYADFTNINIS